MNKFCTELSSGGPLNSIFNEIQILNTLDHPNIIKFYEDIETDQHYHLVMEYF